MYDQDACRRPFILEKGREGARRAFLPRETAFFTSSYRVGTSVSPSPKMEIAAVGGRRNKRPEIFRILRSQFGIFEAFQVVLSVATLRIHSSSRQWIFSLRRYWPSCRALCTRPPERLTLVMSIAWPSRRSERDTRWLLRLTERL